MVLVLTGLLLVFNSRSPLPLVVLAAIPLTFAVLFGINVFYCRYFHQTPLMRKSRTGRWLSEEVKPQKESYFDELYRTGKLWEEMKKIRDEKPQRPVAEPPKRETEFCRECGAKIPRDSTFCEECGEKLI
jgi:ribosomal protein L40E